MAILVFLTVLSRIIYFLHLTNFLVLNVCITVTNEMCNPHLHLKLCHDCIGLYVQAICMKIQLDIPIKTFTGRQIMKWVYKKNNTTYAEYTKEHFRNNREHNHNDLHLVSAF
jgi:hypothetical protein